MKYATIASKRTIAAVIDFFLMTALIVIAIKLFGYPLEVLADWSGNIISFAPLFLIEAILVATWGKTPGMAILCLSTVNLDGSKLSLGMALLRSLYMFVLGIALGIPQYGIIGIAVALNMILMFATGKTIYDRTGGYVVQAFEIPKKRFIFSAVFVILLIVLTIIFSGSDNSGYIPVQY